MKSLSSLIAISFCIAGFAARPAFAKLVFVKWDGAKMVRIAEGEIKATCGKKFVYRAIQRDEVPKYLHHEVVKASLTETIVNYLASAVMKLKNAPGTCSWITEEEADKLEVAL